MMMPVVPDCGRDSRNTHKLRKYIAESDDHHTPLADLSSDRNKKLVQVFGPASRRRLMDGAANVELGSDACADYRNSRVIIRMPCRVAKPSSLFVASASRQHACTVNQSNCKAAMSRMMCDLQSRMGQIAQFSGKRRKA